MSSYDHILKFIAEAIRKELIDQGHYIAPGGLSDDIATKVAENIDSVELQVYMRNYAQFINRGVRPENIPFSGVAPRGQGKGSKSAYIQGLIRWGERRGFDDPKGAAFAIAFTQSKAGAGEGMPTRNSQSSEFTKTGARTAFIEEMEKKNISQITAMINSLQGESVNLHITNLIKKYGDPRSNMEAR